MAEVEKYNAGEAMGIIAHTERTCSTHSNKNIDPTRTHLNYSLWPKDDPDPLAQSRATARMRKRLQEVSYLKRNDVNVLCDWCIHLGVDVPLGYENQRQFFDACVRYICELYGADNVMYAWVHMDEDTPHIHVGFVPVIKKPLKLRKNASAATRAAYEEAVAAGKTYVERVDADSVISLRHLQGWHPAFQKSLTEQLGYDPGVHTGITQALGGNLTVKQLKRKPPDWREQRNKQAAAFHAARKAAKEGRKASLNDTIAMAAPKPQAQPSAPPRGSSLDSIIGNARSRSGEH